MDNVRAVGFRRYGGPEVLESMSLPRPRPMEGNAIVRLLCTSVNRIDTLVRNGGRNLPLAMPHVPGCDVVGIVEEIRGRSDGVSVGDLVVANTLYGCGGCASCRNGDEVSCSRWKMVGVDINGSYEEFVRVPTSTLVRPPGLFSAEELAAMPISLSIAWRALRVVGKAKRGETVVIRGASGSSGIFGLLLAKAMGLRTIAVSRDAIKMKKLREMGADIVIGGGETEAGIADTILGATDGEGADIVIEPFGATLAQSIRLARHGGRIVVYGALAGAAANIDIKQLYLKNISVAGTHNSSRGELKEAMGFLAEMRIRPVIAKVMGLEEAARAHSLLEGGRCFGKILLRP